MTTSPMEVRWCPAVADQASTRLCGSEPRGLCVRRALGLSWGSVPCLRVWVVSVAVSESCCVSVCLSPAFIYQPGFCRQARSRSAGLGLPPWVGG